MKNKLGIKQQQLLNMIEYQDRLLMLYRRTLNILTEDMLGNKMSFGCRDFSKLKDDKDFLILTDVIWSLHYHLFIKNNEKELPTPK